MSHLYKHDPTHTFTYGDTREPQFSPHLSPPLPPSMSHPIHPLCAFFPIHSPPPSPMATFQKRVTFPAMCSQNMLKVYPGFFTSLCLCSLCPPEESNQKILDSNLGFIPPCCVHKGNLSESPCLHL